jgi:hypothetical protein
VGEYDFTSGTEEVPILGQGVRFFVET